jgi:3alpha(or 20beta)-hydroxysteroid dehydrogenase
MGRLDGKIAFITGAARGMGEAEARLFVAEGARVVLADTLVVEGEKVSGELGSDALFVPLDVTDEQGWRDALSATEVAFGVPDVLVNNAGILRFAPVLGTDKADFEEILQVNLLGPFLGMKFVGAAMAASGRGGSIVNVSSTGGMIGYAGIGAYVASKWGLRGLTKSAALELGSLGIRVNSVHPGGVRTPMTDPDGTGTMIAAAQFAGQPIARIGRPEEIAHLALFLASDESSYCTGSEFVADGGATAGQGLAITLDVA